MIDDNAPFAAAALVSYRNRPALVRELAGDKIVIALSGGETVKVRGKDIEPIHPGPAKSLDGIGRDDGDPNAAAPETWELLLADEGCSVSLKELAELAFGEYTPASAWAAFRLLLDGLYFAGNVAAITPRQRDLVEADGKKRGEKQRADGERGLFLERLKTRGPFFAEPGPDCERADAMRLIQDVEALAYGKSAKSRTMKDIGLGETPEEAHALLLETGFWAKSVNPHPTRFGISLLPARHVPDAPCIESDGTSDRIDLSHLPAFAIDSPWSHDPDDALSLETRGDTHILHVHVADPAASITPDSPCEKEARDRGATLYVPEGSFRMLAEEALPLFALGLAETSPALTFRMTLDSGGKILETDIFPSMVRVSRLTYEAADGLIAGGNCGTAEILRNLDALARRNLNRRTASGAINIEMPEAHIQADGDRVTVEPIVRYKSAALVRECMLLAGEAAGGWAMQRGLPIPCIAQETGDLPGEVLPGMAGDYQLRRCMRPRVLSTKPGLHSGLGLDIYTQVTSPLRRYTDLLSHIQIRSALRGGGATGAGGALSADELASRMFAGEAAAAIVSQTERASRGHWMMVYLSEKKDSVWDAVALEKRGSR
ncbi:MAG: ribonuclease catalytic domain-containing protein, partial [Treponema sp.]|nr:ribonuclease catalytic domain-containing protein [Treponema sp.]